MFLGPSCDQPEKGAKEDSSQKGGIVWYGLQQLGDGNSGDTALPAWATSYASDLAEDIPVWRHNSFISTVLTGLVSADHSLLNYSLPSNVRAQNDAKCLQPPGLGRD